MKKIIRAFILSVSLLALLNISLAEPAAVDLDLSLMPTSVAYAQAIAMQREPDGYLGLTVRVGGIFNYSEARQRGVVIIADRSGCCETSLDFVCAGDPCFPDDYPELYSRITVVGIFSTEDGEENAFRLTDAVLER